MAATVVESSSSVPPTDSAEQQQQPPVSVAPPAPPPIEQAPAPVNITTTELEENVIEAEIVRYDPHGQSSIGFSRRCETRNANNWKSRQMIPIRRLEMRVAVN